MAVQDYAWLFMAVAIFGVILNIAAVVFLSNKWSKYPRPTKWALAGLGVMILGQIGYRVLLTLFSQWFDTNNILLFNAIASLAITVAHFAGLCMLIVAVYVDRNPITDSMSANAIGGRSDTGTLESNPYAV